MWDSLARYGYSTRIGLDATSAMTLRTVFALLEALASPAVGRKRLEIITFRVCSPLLIGLLQSPRPHAENLRENPPVHRNVVPKYALITSPHVQPRSSPRRFPTVGDSFSENSCG